MKKLIIIFLSCVPAIALAMGHSYGYHSYHSSHHVDGYYKKNDEYVRPHYAGNPESGNHWHLHKDGSDTEHKSNGSSITIPDVPNN